MRENMDKEMIASVVPGMLELVRMAARGCYPHIIEHRAKDVLRELEIKGVCCSWCQECFDHARGYPALCSECWDSATYRERGAFQQSVTKGIQ